MLLRRLVLTGGGSKSSLVSETGEMGSFTAVPSLSVMVFGDGHGRLSRIDILLAVLSDSSLSSSLDVGVIEFKLMAGMMCCLLRFRIGGR